MNCHVEVTLNLKGAPPRDCDEREPPARPNHPVLDRAPFHSKRSKNANEEPVRRLVAHGLLHSSCNRVSVMKENIVIKVTKNKKQKRSQCRVTIKCRILATCSKHLNVTSRANRNLFTLLLLLISFLFTINQS